MSSEELILTITNTLIFIINTFTILASGLNIFHNGRYFWESNKIRRKMLIILVLIFLTSCWFFIPGVMWIVDKSYLKIDFEESFFWAIVHFGMFAICTCYNELFCLVGVKSCEEQRKSLLEIKDRITKNSLVDNTVLS